MCAFINQVTIFLCVCVFVCVCVCVCVDITTTSCLSVNAQNQETFETQDTQSDLFGSDSNFTCCLHETIQGLIQGVSKLDELLKMSGFSKGEEIKIYYEAVSK